MKPRHFVTAIAAAAGLFYPALVPMPDTQAATLASLLITVITLAVFAS
jgi:hypothetical protein